VSNKFEASCPVPPTILCVVPALVFASNTEQISLFCPVLYNLTNQTDS
jgi:hypothetical protein